MNDGSAPAEETRTIPLLKDHHTHPLFYAACMDGIDLRHVDSKDGAVAVIAAQTQCTGDGLLLGVGWQDSKYSLHSDDIESAVPTVILNLSLHGALVNSAAERLLERQCGAEIEQWTDPQWYERNMRLVLDCITKMNATVERLRRFFDRLLLESGVVYAEEMLLVDEQELTLFDQAGLLDRTRFWAAPDTYQELSPRGREMVHGLKLFSDGAIGVRTAAVNTPYDTGSRGFLTHDDDQLSSTIEQCLATGKPLAIHAIGDRAIEQVIESLSRLPSGCCAGQVRLEHAQLITKRTARQAKDLGVTLCMQPNFSTDSIDYVDRLASHYRSGNNPFRMLIDEIGFIPGDDLIFGSDGMPHGAKEALQRSLFPPYEGQRLTLDEFVSGYCMDDLASGMIEVTIAGNEINLNIDCSDHRAGE